ncbi:carboxypeptidase-like regulatory domain-containing protein [Maribellus maritimus]|uniref:carboxypeptidase-like regulatory domain-containing protein n=1 Tax=Maribellus maritimus TaxID=2870838 RepID=UPI001EEADAEC|nr:carboxypeptidase-like regulatory domain-containing protein [Maribellus maritimus]MCG6189277.1 carboxypeptidase-like regulatory domain-containing protein [Maribellus maritimus]
MKKNIFIIISSFLLILFNQVTNAQILLKETAWLQTNRDIYLSGEDLYFKVNLLENDTYHPSALSKNIRLELTDVTGNSIIRKNFELENSEIFDKFLLPGNIKTGKYYLRAYSNWMRNFSEDGFSELELRVLNVKDANQDSLLLKNNSVNIRIFPYSNPDDIQQPKCSIFSSNKYGKGMESEGFILSGQGDTVLTFHSNKTGWASSYYKAADKSKYQVFVKGFQKDNVSFEVNTIHNPDDQISSSVIKENENLSVNIKGVHTGNNYKLLLHRTYSWSWFHTTVAENNSIIFHIPLKDIPVGLSQITVLDEENKIIFKQLWSDYGENVSDIKIEMDTSNITTDSYTDLNYYSERTSFNMNNPESLQILAGRFFPESKMQLYLPGLPGWLANYKIPSDKNGFDGWINANLYPDEIVNSFFISDKKFPTLPNLKNTPHFIRHYPETRGGILSGRIYNKITGQAVSNVNIALTVLNDNGFYATKTDPGGKFVFTFPSQNFSKDYVLNYIDKYDSLWQLDIIPDYEASKPKKLSKVAFTAKELEFLKSQILTVQLRNLYFTNTENTSAIKNDTTKTEEMFYGKPEIKVEVSDYIHLANARELIFEVVPFVAVRRQNEKDVLVVAGDNLFSSKYPTLILFDGIPIYDYQKLLELPTERIKTIEAKTNFYIHENAIFEGIINIRSVKNDLGGLNFPKTAILSTIHLPDKANNQSVKAQKSELEGLPNLDDILVWKDLKKAPKEKENIYFNSNPGKYSLLIYGYSKDGKWNSGSLILNIR